MSERVLPFLCFTLIIQHIHCVSDELHVDQTEWIDVNDPLSWERNGNRDICSQDVSIESQKRISELEKDILICKANSEDKLLKRIVRQFLHRMNIELLDGNGVYKDAQVYLSAKDVKILRKFLDNEYPSDDVGVRERVRTAMGAFLTEKTEQTPTFMRYIEPYTPYIMLMNVAILPVAFLFILKRIMSPRQLLIVLFLWAFCASFTFTYARKYREILAERYDRSDRDDKCIKDKSFMGELSDVLLGYLRIKGKSECLKKYEDILIEPFLLIDPLATFGEVLTNFFMSPLEVAGKQLNRFFNDFFIDTPLPLAVFKVVFLFLLLFFFMGYRLRTLLFSVEPVFKPAESMVTSIDHTSNMRLRETTPMIQEVHSCPALADEKSVKPVETMSSLAIENLLEEIDIELDEEGNDAQAEDTEIVDVPAVFYTALTYEQSEVLLSTKEKGVWLLRNSRKMPSNMALSIRGPSRCHHIIIFYTEKLTYRLGDSSVTFTSLQAMFNHYRRHPVLRDGPTTLGRPLLRENSN